MLLVFRVLIELCIRNKFVSKIPKNSPMIWIHFAVAFYLIFSIIIFNFTLGHCPHHSLKQLAQTSNSDFFKGACKSWCLVFSGPSLPYSQNSFRWSMSSISRVQISGFYLLEFLGYIVFWQVPNFECWHL